MKKNTHEIVYGRGINYAMYKKYVRLINGKMHNLTNPLVFPKTSKKDYSFKVIILGTGITIMTSSVLSSSSVLLSSAEINKRIIRLKKMLEENEKFYDKFQIWKHAVEQSDRKKKLSTMKELKMITDNLETNKPKNNITTSTPKKKGRKKHDIYSGEG